MYILHFKEYLPRNCGLVGQKVVILECFSPFFGWPYNPHTISTTRLPIYAMQTTNLPACVKDKVDHACRRFLWSGVNKERKLSQVSWSIVCKPKISGGLGFKNLNLMNQAMLMKFFWALFPRPRACRLKFYARRTGLILGFLRLNYLTKMVPIFGAR